MQSTFTVKLVPSNYLSITLKLQNHFNCMSYSCLCCYEMDLCKLFLHIRYYFLKTHPDFVSAPWSNTKPSNFLWAYCWYSVQFHQQWAWRIFFSLIIRLNCHLTWFNQPDMTFWCWCRHWSPPATFLF